MTADKSIVFVIILDPAQAHSVDLADLEDGDLDNEEEDPICHSSTMVKDLQNILCVQFFGPLPDSVFCPAPGSRSG